MLAAWGLERVMTAAMRKPGIISILGRRRVRRRASCCSHASVYAFLSVNAQWGEANLAAFQAEHGDLEAALADMRAILAERPGRFSAGKAG